MLQTHISEAHEYEKYEQMSYNDQFEVKQIICDNLCWSGWHKCFAFDEDNEIGVNLREVDDDDNFPCEKCAYKSEDIEDVKKHFQTIHNGNYVIKCWECAKQFNQMCEFKQHIGTYHYTPCFEGEPGPRSDEN